MKRYYKYVFAIVGVLAVIFILYYSTTRDDENLDNWIGEYQYTAIFPHNSGEMSYVIEYNISIYKEEYKYYAKITNDGWQTMTRVLAQITGDQNIIEIAYLHTLPDDIIYGNEWFDKGEVLWQFERNGDDINTVWMAARRWHPTLSDVESEIIGKYFEKKIDRKKNTLESGMTDPGNAREESEALVEKSEQVEDPEDDVAAVCEMMRAMDFTVEQPHMELTEEEDRAYKEAFLRLLKNELPIKGWPEEYYQDLWKAGTPYGDLLEERDNVGYPYSYYYDDIDGDGKPEFGVEQGCAFFFDYEQGEDACSISYHAESKYFKKLLGVGRIWEHDGTHAGVVRNQYIVLNSDGEWEPVIDLQHFSGEEQDSYVINRVHVGKEIWEELTAPFFEATEHEVPAKTLREVFGELLDADWHRSVETRKEIFNLEREKVDEDVPHFSVRVEFPQLESTLYPATIEQANANLRDSAFEILGGSYEEVVAQLTELEQDLSEHEYIRISYDILQVTEDEFHILFEGYRLNGSVPEYFEEYQITINLKTGERVVHAKKRSGMSRQRSIFI